MPTPYREGQNVIRNGLTGEIVYLPPEAQDVAPLMGDLIAWLDRSEAEEIPCPFRAAIAHYQYATIHPYYDGNGRTARLFANWVLHTCGYGLKGIYSLDDYYAHDLISYYEALSIGPSHNYYFGRAEADISDWLSYFCEGMVQSFEKVKGHAEKELQKEGAMVHDASPILRTLIFSQAPSIGIDFLNREVITAKDIENFFRISGRTARDWCQKWVQEGFLLVEDSSQKKSTVSS